MRGRTWVKSRVSEQTWLRVFRADAATEQRGRCRYCGEPLSAANITGDHLLARSRGGTTERNNIKAACRDCNMTKGSLSESAFLALIKRQPEPGSSIYLWLAWSRRRLWMRTHRACERIARAAGIAA